MKKGILIVAHGSRLREVNEEFKQLVEVLKLNTGKDVRGANLSLAEPSIEDTIKTMYDEGTREIDLIPYFLSNGKHVAIHIPSIISKMEGILEGINITLKETLVMDPLVVKALENKINKS